jgi:hypothetical protein
MKICNKTPFLKINIKTIKHVYYAIVLDIENFQKKGKRFIEKSL